jgi:hypothetical protein
MPWKRKVPLPNWTDQDVGQWHVIGLIEKLKKDQNYRWLCECRHCGKRAIATTGNIRHGRTRCECQAKPPYVRPPSGQTLRCLNFPEWLTWSALRRRSGNRVCKRWRDSFAAFLEDMGKRPLGCGIVRWDHRKGYSKENCFWKPGGGQCRKLIEYKGKMIPRAVFLRETGVTMEFLQRRVYADKTKTRITNGDEIEAAHKKYRKLLKYREEQYRAKQTAKMTIDISIVDPVDIG